MSPINTLISFKQINLVLKRSAQTYEAMDEGCEAHWEVVERILFIYAKLNPGQSYVQGMNEIIGPIYYVFASDPDPEFKSNVLHIILNCDFSTFISSQNMPKPIVSFVSLAS